MNYKTTLSLLFLLALVGGYFYFVEFGTMSGYEAHEQGKTHQANQPEGELLFDGLASSAIDGLTIQRGSKTVTVEKQNDQWYQTRPVRFPLNEYSISSITRQIADLRYVEKVAADDPEAPTPEQMGLDQPRATVTFHANDKDTTLKLGKHTLAGHAYVQIEGQDTAYVVSHMLHGAVLDQDTNDWRMTSLELPEASAAISASLFPASGHDVFLVKDDGRWILDSKSPQRISQIAVDDWFSELGRIWINGFVEDNPENLTLYGLNEDYMRIRVTQPGAGEGAEVEHTLHIGIADLEGKNRYAALTTGSEPISVIFTISASSADSLAKSQTDLTDPKVIPVDTYDVRRVTVEQDGRTTLDLIRDPQQGYSFGDPDPGYQADYSASHDLVQKLCELESTEYNAELSSLGAAVAAVRIQQANQENPLTFTVHDQGEKRAVVNEGESIAYLVPMGALDVLLGSPLGLRNRTVFEIEPASLASMSLKRDDGQVFEFTPKPGEDGVITWQIQNTANMESAVVAALPQLLNPLRAERWLAEPVEPLGNWIEWTLVPIGGSPITIKASPDTGYALMTGVDTAFALPKETIARLTAEFRNQTVLDLDIQQIASVQFTSSKTSVTLSRDGQMYTIDTGEVDQQQAAAVFDLLAGLHVDRYTQPLNHLPSDVDFSLELTTTDGETIAMKFIPTDAGTVTVSLQGDRGRDHKGWFRLSKQVVDRLRAPLTAAENPVK